MIAWLSDWLRDIIAILLLAVVVELLLPNKSMQRYARLVVGLFILLTILSPILKLLQSDMGARLEAGMAKWNEQSMQRELQMPSLQDIQKGADRLIDKRNQEAVKLTERTLEEAMHEEIRTRTKANVQSVDVSLAWEAHAEASSIVSIRQVAVTLKPAADKAEQPEQPNAIEAVEPVFIQIEIEADDKQLETGQQGNAEERSDLIEISAGNEIRSVIMQGWGVASDQIVIRQVSNEPKGERR